MHRHTNAREFTRDIVGRLGRCFEVDRGGTEPNVRAALPVRAKYAWARDSRRDNERDNSPPSLSLCHSLFLFFLPSFSLCLSPAESREGGARHAHATPARSGTNPLTAGVAPFPPASTRQPLTPKLFPGPRAVDLPPTTPAPPTLPSPPPPPSRNRRALPAGVYYCETMLTLRSRTEFSVVVTCPLTEWLARTVQHQCRSLYAQKLF